MRRKVDTADQQMARLAGCQHGVVSFRQLQSIGMTTSAVTHRVRTGRLHRLHQGVYAVGHANPSAEGKLMAAVLASGAGAVVSHRSAAALWGLLTGATGAVHVTVPSSAGKSKREGIRLHRTRSLATAETTRRNGIPVTKPGRTIEDLRRTVSAREVRRAIRQAEVLGLPLGPDVESDRTRSDLERLFLHLCRRHRLPEPHVNVRVDRFLVDFLWRERRLIVETDGYKYHRGRSAFLSDHDRDLKLRALGYEVIRLSEEQLANEPAFAAGVLKNSLEP
jgi:very-short-patch-repair endonuclease